VRALPLLVAALALAGCASAPRDATQPWAAFDPTPLGARFHAPHLVEETITEASVSLNPGPASLPVNVPTGAIRVVYWLTFQSGASVYPRADLDACTVQLNGTIAADGQTFGRDCGALPAGTLAMRLDQTGGAVSLLVRANATVRVCEPTYTPASCAPAYGDRVGYGYHG
jgi:hypothetical protein